MKVAMSLWAATPKLGLYLELPLGVNELANAILARQSMPENDTAGGAMQACTGYTGRLPPKQLGFGTSQSVQFVEQRRLLLDTYLQYVVSEPSVAGTSWPPSKESAWYPISKSHGLACQPL